MDPKRSEQDGFDGNCEFPLDKPNPKALARAHEKVDELQELLDAAKIRFRQLGGEIPGDREKEMMEHEHKQ